MTLRTRLTLQFIAPTAVLLAGVLAAVLVMFGRSLRAEFNARLRDRAEVATALFLQNETLSAARERQVQRRFLEKMPDEVLQIYDSKLRARFIEEDRRVRLSERLLARILTEHEVYFSLGERQAVGLFITDNQGEFVVVAAASDRYAADRLRRLGLAMVVAFGGSLAVLYVLGRWFAKRALAPISALNDEADQITASDLHRRLSEGAGQDELTRLARTFNRLLGRLKDSFTAQRAFVANASHELRTPLTATIGELQVLATRARSVEEYRTALGSVLDELLHLKDLSNDLLDLAQATGGGMPNVPDEVRLDEALEDAIGIVRAARSGAKLRLNFDDLPADPDVLVRRGNRRLLTRALVNLLDNACKYSDDEVVEVLLSVKQTQLTLCIRDRGIGIMPDEQKLVFEPFYRGANARAHQGHGIGLALAERILAQHGGQMRLTSTPGEGTEVVVTFR